MKKEKKIKMLIFQRQSDKIFMDCNGDYIEITKNEKFIIRGRSDATLNPGGVRIGTAEIYQQVEDIDFVTEGLVVGQNFNNDENYLICYN